MVNIINNLKQEFKKGNILNKLLYINVGLFLLFSILGVFSFMFQFDIQPTLSKLCLPADNTTFLHQPWAIISYMFLHNDFLHLLFNMIWLYFGGKIFLQYLNPKQLLSIYILGGISGGLLFIIAYNYIPALTMHTHNALALGASASVLAIVVAIATYTPNYNVRFPFIGIIKLKHIALFCVVLDLLSIPQGNSGGHIAHLGGALFGYFCIKQMQKGNDYTIGFTKWLNRLVTLFKRNSKLKTVHKRSKSDSQFNKERTEKQKAVDLILEKISKSGYESLSKEEKATLFSASKK